MTYINRFMEVWMPFCDVLSHFLIPPALEPCSNGTQMVTVTNSAGFSQTTSDTAHSVVIITSHNRRGRLENDGVPKMRRAAHFYREFFFIW